MTRFIFSITILFAVVGGAARGVETSSNVLGQLGPKKADSQNRTFAIYSKVPLWKPQFRLEKSDAWISADTLLSFPGHFVYTSKTEVLAEQGAEFLVQAYRMDGTRFTDSLILNFGKDDLVAFEVTNKENLSVAEANKIRTEEINRDPHSASKEAIYGGSQFCPREVAQARANEMARIESMVHLPNAASVQTNIGPLCEGIGMCGAGGIPGTCTATNGTAALGDGITNSRGGSCYRCRIYNSPGTASGGGGGGGGRGRRGRR